MLENKFDAIERVKARWDFSRRLPYPKWKVRCPCCDSQDTIIRNWTFNTRETGGKTPFRCNVGIKCTDCSMAWIHGLVVPEEVWRDFGGKRIERREGAVYFSF